MNFAAVFVRRPVFATMLVALLLVLGIFSYQKLGVDLFPNVDLPVVTVTTVLRGASPEEMEAQVTKPIEEAVSTSSGIDELRSTTLEGLSIVTVTFVLERPSAEAVQDVRDKVAAAFGNLPEDTEPPVITRFDTDAIPVATIVLSGARTLKEITEYADKIIKPSVESLNGVGQATLVGGQKRAINVWLEASKMRAYGLSAQDVRTALIAQNVELPTGRIDRTTSEQVLRTMGRIENVDDFFRLVVATRGSTPILLGEIARAEDGVEEPRSLSRYDGTTAVALVVQKQSGTNSVEVVHRINGKLKEISETLPPGMKIENVRDISGFIEDSIGEVKLHLVLGGVLASIVVLLFMGSWRSTLIASIAIPTSLIATFTVMGIFGFTLNNLTLLGLVLAVGIVIDDAIVVLENVFRHIDEFGKTPFQAALDGTKEIMLAVVATTTSLVIIFLPIAFMSGRVGRFFHSFGITVAVAIAMSLVIAVTLTPMLCSKLLRPAKPGHSAHDVTQGTWLNRKMHALYGVAVKFSLEHPWIIVAVGVGCVVAVVPLFKIVGKDFIPVDDRSEFNVVVQTPPGSTLTASDRIMKDLEQRIGKLPMVKHLLTTIGDTGNGNEDVTQCSLYVKLIDLEARKEKTTQFDVMKMVRKLLQEYPELRTAVQPVNDIQQGGAANFQFNYAIRGTDLEALDRVASAVLVKMRQVPGIVDADTATAQRKPEVRVEIDRKRAADLGVRAGDIANSLRTLVAGEPVSKFREGAEQYDVWLRLRPEDRQNESAISQLQVPTALGTLVELRNVVSLRDDMGPAQIDRLDRQRQVTLVANLDGVPLGTAMAKVDKFFQEVKPPPGYTAAPLGRAKTFAETGRNFAIAFALSFLFMYMVLAAQFESFLHPVTIMLSLPLSIPFALISVTGLGDTLNLYSVIGVFMLFGIVKKNGILQVDYTNTLRAEKNMGLREAIFQANLVRLRPILMTTVTLIAGMIPIALGKGPGASARASMARVIIGGQALSLLITLLIVPVGYLLFDQAGGFLRNQLPEDIRRRRPYALVFLAGASALGAWLLMVTAGSLGDLPAAAQVVSSVLAKGGLALALVGIVMYRIGRKKHATATDRSETSPR